MSRGENQDCEAGVDECREGKTKIARQEWTNVERGKPRLQGRSGRMSRGENQDCKAGVEECREGKTKIARQAEELEEIVSVITGLD